MLLFLTMMTIMRRSHVRLFFFFPTLFNSAVFVGQNSLRKGEERKPYHIDEKIIDWSIEKD